MLTPEQMEEAVEAMARAIDPQAWADDLPIPTRAHTIAFHVGRAASNAKARAALTAALPVIERAVLSAHVETLRRALEWMKNASTSMEIEWGTWQTQAEVERDGKVSEKEIADMEDLIRTLAGEER